MIESIKNEIAKLTAQGAQVVNSICNPDGSVMNTRSSELSQFKGGDILQFPESLVGAVVKSPVRNAVNNDGSQLYACYIPVDVTRNVAGKEVHKVIPFYPSAFWKSRQECDAGGMKIEGKYHRASGEVAEFVSSFATVDEAIPETAKKGKVVVTVDTFNTLPFGAEEGTKPVKTSVMSFEWA